MGKKQPEEKCSDEEVSTGRGADAESEADEECSDEEPAGENVPEKQPDHECSDDEEEEEEEKDSSRSETVQSQIAKEPNGDCSAAGATKMPSESEREKLRVVQVRRELESDDKAKETDSGSESERSQSEAPVRISKKPSTKRTAHSVESGSRESKRQKPNPKAVIQSSVTRKLFQRLYSHGDEIAILEGLIRYSKEGISASQEPFHSFIQKYLDCVVTQSQLQDKIRKLKSNYIADIALRRVYSDSHNQKRIELSKQLWGQDEKIGSSIGKNKSFVGKDNRSKMMAAMAEIKAVADGCGGAPLTLKSDLENVGEWSYMAELSKFVEKNKHLISEKKKSELAVKQKEVEVAEAKLSLMKLDLIKEEAKLVLRALK